MSSTDGDHDGRRKIDIDCKESSPVFLAFTPDARIVSGERCSNVPGIRLQRYQVDGTLDKDTGLPDDSSAMTISCDIDTAVVSRDGKWIVSITGTKVMVSNTTTEQVAEVDEHSSEVPVHAIDLSPDSKKFATGSEDKTVRIFAVNTRKILLALQHNNSVLGVKFSPNGERLATAADLIRVWDARNGYLLYYSRSNYAPQWATIGPEAITQKQTCIMPLGWSNDNETIFTVFSRKIVKFQVVKPPVDTGYYYNDYYSKAIDYNRLSETCSEELVAKNSNSSLHELATNGKIIACAAGGSLLFWDTSSSSKIGPTVNFQDSILSIALSSDGSYLGCRRGDKKITVYSLKDILSPPDILDPTSHIPLMKMNYAAFKPWIEQNLSAADTSVWQELQSGSCTSKHHALANLALIRARLRQWDAAIENANESLSTQSSIIGHIAKAVVLVGQGRHELALEGFDVVFHNCGADDNKFLSLIKAILLFLSGKREYAITRVNDIIAVADNSTKYNCLQVLGNMYLMQGDLEHTVEAFERAQSLSFYRQGFHMVTILLIFGRSFEEHEITVRHPWRKAATA